jgi:rhodanese-related sulfurtransferase
VQQVPTVEAAAVPPDAVLLDVRENDEWAAGHIPGSVHVPMMRVPQQLQFEPGPLTPDAEIVVVCKVGARSAHVTAWLRRQGYAATNLAGGMLAWQAAGRRLESDGGGPAEVV